jgi:DNA-directed RNA polymerase subunit RPC12/RpoP
MTYEVVCRKCGATLYSGFDLRSPEDILRPIGYKCKKCGIKLTTQRFDVQIKKLDGTFA